MVIDLAAARAERERMRALRVVGAVLALIALACLFASPGPA